MQTPGAPQFDADFRDDLYRLMAWRRDVRHFRGDPVDEAVLMRCLSAFQMAPSVGLSEPWRVVRVQSGTARTAAITNFEAANAQALAGYDGADAATYAGLKLSGMREAPVHLAVFCDEATTQGRALGRTTMPEMLRYSVVGAIQLFWLAARTEGLGVGWVSILDPDALCTALDVPPDWRLVGYLCVGWPVADHDTPELERAGWETRVGSLPLEVR